MAPLTHQFQQSEVTVELPASLADIFDLEPATHDIDALGVFLSEEDEGDTTGDGCGESPPQGPTTGC
ncbi:hypothetical protein AB0D49_40520 [Streptomyces sp. NPDC048290]|uniref:hypothetical protein n=1 Tax=Streptomyces sp. NPDC048290 TaxID=3155811 RepID=UPI00341E83B7